ncbi:MAG: DUF2064 domain-containing protein [Crocinitomix sp.]|nr:DUF2064 domain-containing protein [Crocinitomix sp.]
MQAKQTALLLFTRHVRDEGREKRIFGLNYGKNFNFFQALNDKAVQTIKATGLPFYICSGESQNGDSFAERYQNAIQSIFEKGYNRVITIGNDSPELTAAILLNIQQELDGHDLVYGATQNGGIYTLGLTKQGFDSFEFEKMAWQTESLISDFDILGRDNSKILKLDFVLAEFNAIKDVREFLIHISNNINDKILYSKIFQLFFDFKIPKLKEISSFSEFFSAEIALRGPPQDALLLS